MTRRLLNLLTAFYTLVPTDRPGYVSPMSADKPHPVLPYSRRTPVSRIGRQAFAVVRNHSTTTVAVFPRGAKSVEVLFSLALLGGLITVPAAMAYIVIQPGTHPGARALGVCLVVGFLFVAALAALIAAVMFEWAFSQVEFDASPDGLFFVASWWFGVRRRRWARSEIADLRVVPQRNPATSELVVVPVQGGEESVLRASTGTAREVERTLRQALGL